MNPNELRAQAEEFLAAARAIQNSSDDGAMTEEQEREFQSNVSQAESLIEQADAIEASEARAAERSETLSRLTAAAGTNGRTVQPARETAHPNVTVGEDRIVYDESGGFESFGHFAQAVFNAGIPGGARDDRLKYLGAATGLNQASPSDGGFTTPKRFGTEVMESVMGEPDSLFARCDQYPVEGESLEMPAVHETSRADGSRQGGIRGYWLEEAEQITSSKPKFNRVKVQPHELGVLVYATNKLLRNSVMALERFLKRGLSSEINFMVGDALVNGNGVAKPLGILNAACLVTQAAEGSQTATTIKTANIDKMWSRLPVRSRKTAIWLCNQDCEPQIQQLDTDTGNGGVPLYRADIKDDNGLGRLYGAPLIPVEYCATLGTVGDLILADLNMMLCGLQGGVDIAESIHLRFDYNETAFRAIFPIDAQPWLTSAITPKNGSNTLSPFVALATRS